jgi:Phosphomannomutase
LPKNNSDIGLAFDGDADRLGVISPSGEMIFPEMQMIIFQ